MLKEEFMDKYSEALQRLISRLTYKDAYTDKDINLLKEFIKYSLEQKKAIEVMKKHVKVQDYPDLFFRDEMPERMLIDLRYLIDTGDWSKKPKNIEENNANYNLVKHILGLPNKE